MVRSSVSFHIRERSKPSQGCDGEAALCQHHSLTLTAADESRKNGSSHSSTHLVIAGRSARTRTGFTALAANDTDMGLENASVCSAV